MKKSIIMQVDEVTAPIMQGIQKNLAQGVTEAAFAQIEPLLAKMEAQSGEISGLLAQLREGGQQQPEPVAVEIPDEMLSPFREQNSDIMAQLGQQQETHQQFKDQVLERLASQDQALERLWSKLPDQDRELHQQLLNQVEALADKTQDLANSSTEMEAVKQEFKGLSAWQEKLQETTDKIMHGLEVVTGQMRQMNEDHKTQQQNMQEFKDSLAGSGSMKEELDLINRRIGELRESEFSQLHTKIEELFQGVKKISELQELHDQYLQVINENVEFLARKKLFGKTKK